MATSEEWALLTQLEQHIEALEERIRQRIENTEFANAEAHRRRFACGSLSREAAAQVFADDAEQIFAALSRSENTPRGNTSPQVRDLRTRM